MKTKIKNNRPLFDTNVFIGRKIGEHHKDRMFISSVVLYELIAANIGDSSLQYYSSLLSKARKLERLITPNAADWFECSKLIRNLLRGTKSPTIGKTKKIISAQQQQNDALIARTATLHDCFVVTENVRDFERFKPYMNDLIVVPADYFFGR